jgi:hypothetical protein
MKQVVLPVISLFMKMGGTFVDFSCGDNEIGRLLTETGRARQVFAYDLAPTANAIASGAIRKNWFDVKALPPDACVGLNPPFGKGGRLAQRFISHTLLIGTPKFLFLILPVRESWLVPGYVEERRIVLPINAFQLPNGQSFSYPSRFHVFRHAPITALANAARQAPPATLPAGFRIRTTAPVDKSCLAAARMTLFVRRVGLYAGYQLYLVVNRHTILYFDKHTVSRKTWTQMSHYGASTFATVTLPRAFMTQHAIERNMPALTRWFNNVAHRMARHVSAHSLTTKAEDRLRTRSVNRARIVGMIHAGFFI